MAAAVAGMIRLFIHRHRIAIQIIIVIVISIHRNATQASSDRIINSIIQNNNNDLWIQIEMLNCDADEQAGHAGQANNNNNA